jgi:hypothetical protein
MSSSANSVLILSFSRIGRDPRVLRQLQLVGDTSKVTILGFSPPPKNFEGVFIPLRTDALVDSLDISGGPLRQRIALLLAIISRVPAIILLQLGAYRFFYLARPWARDAISKMKTLPEFKLVIANEFESLPAIVFGKIRARKIILDVHEYSPDESGAYLRSRILNGYINKWLIPRFAKLPQSIFTVSPGIQAVYKANFSLEMGLLPNAAAFTNLMPNPVSSTNIRLVHHGVADPSRNIEMLFDLVHLLPSRYELYLYLVPGPASGYLARIRRSQAKNPRIIFKDPVPTPELPKTLNAYDIGVITYDSSSTNHRLSLPNKFFEYVQARLAVLMGPSEEMIGFGKDFEFRILSPSVTAQSYAKALLELSDSRLEELKNQASEASKPLSFEELSTDFRTAINEVLDR